MDEWEKGKSHAADVQLNADQFVSYCLSAAHTGAEKTQREWNSSRMHIADQWQRQQLATISMAANTKRSTTDFGTSSIFISKKE